MKIGWNFITFALQRFNMKIAAYITSFFHRMTCNVYFACGTSDCGRHKWVQQGFREKFYLNTMNF
jgi:hypothetical protein